MNCPPWTPGLLRPRPSRERGAGGRGAEEGRREGGRGRGVDPAPVAPRSVRARGSRLPGGAGAGLLSRPSRRTSHRASGGRDGGGSATGVPVDSLSGGRGRRGDRPGLGRGGGSG